MRCAGSNLNVTTCFQRRNVTKCISENAQVQLKQVDSLINRKRIENYKFLQTKQSIHREKNQRMNPRQLLSEKKVKMSSI